MKTISLYLIICIGLTIISCKDKAIETGSEEIAVAAEGQGKAYTTDANMSQLNWEGSKPTGKHMGNIKITEGTLYADSNTVTAGNFTIDMTSINVTDLEGDDKASLEAHLKGTETDGATDFFNVTQFPTAQFEITKVGAKTDTPPSNVLVTGNLKLFK